MKNSLENIENLIAYIKLLQWMINKDCIHADPIDLRWKYYITPLIANKFELALIDDSCNCNKKLFRIYNSLHKAKVTAERHYIKVIKNLFIK